MKFSCNISLKFSRRQNFMKSYITTLDTFFVLDTDSRTRGHPWKLKKRRMNTDMRRHFFSERIINWWNKLDRETVCVSTVNNFKNRLQRLWMKDEFSCVFRRLPEPNRACLVGVYAFLIWNNLCDLVYQTPTKSNQSQKSRFSTPTRT